uniref:BTB domain-containing protein n=1 Tax=Syphacia muris TaxID=451379 RepID=A0A0N5AVM0_9BILA
MRSCQIWDQFTAERQALRTKFAEQLRLNMSFLVGDVHEADLLLVSADGSKLPAHQCILHQRAPGFYERFVEPTITAATRSGNTSSVLEVAVGDVDSDGLRFFIRSVYTEDEVAQLPESSTARKQSPSNNDDDKSKKDEDEENESPNSNRMRKFIDGGENFINDDNVPESSDNVITDAQPETYDKNESPAQCDSLENFRNNSLCRLANEDPTAMTSFLELATELPTVMSSSMEQSECDTTIADGSNGKDALLGESAYERFINLNKQRNEDAENYVKPRKRSDSCSNSKQMFQMFIGFEGGTIRHIKYLNLINFFYNTYLNKKINYYVIFKGGTSSEMWRSAPDGIRSRALAARQLSMNSLTSLTSIDVSSAEVYTPVIDRNPSCKLAEDLLNMYLKNIDTDVVVKTDNGELFAHRCILSAMCPYFKDQLQKQRVNCIELKGYSRTAVHFLLSFLYGGLTTIGDDVDAYELVSLATHLNIDSLLQLVTLHFRAKKCHFFHRPCASCVSAVFDALPQFHAIKCLQPLFKEALSWQAKHFARIWKGRVFAHLNSRWQKACFGAVAEEMDEETVIDVVLGCERLQASLPYSRTGKASETVQSLVSDVLDFAQEFLLQSFDAVILSESFQAHGKGLALNIGLLEDLFLPLVHSLSADTAIRSYLNLCKLIEIIHKDMPSPRRGILSPVVDVWNPRFLNLIRRLYELIDKHILHYAASAVKTESWKLLNVNDQKRIKETGIFVEMKQPRAPPPKFSSFNRAYKRSTSAGVQLYGVHEQANFSERRRPFTVTEQADDNVRVFDSAHRMEVIDEKVPRRTNSLKVRTHKTDDNETSVVLTGAKTPQQNVVEEEAKDEKKTSSGLKQQDEKRKKSLSSSPKGSPRRKWTDESGVAIEKLVDITHTTNYDELQQQRLERQHTQTVISAPSKNLVIPKIDSAVTMKSVIKPKSVVKPMVSERQHQQMPSSTSTSKDNTHVRSRPYSTSKIRRSQEKISVSTESHETVGKVAQPKLSSKLLPSTGHHTLTNIEKNKRRLTTDVRKDLSRRTQTVASRIPRSPKTARKSSKNDAK